MSGEKTGQPDRDDTGALAENREDDDTEGLAEDRTNLAEDRTLLANERTFSSWMGTGLTAVGVGAGFHVLFSKVEPTFLPKSVTTLLIGVGIIVFLTALQRAKQVRKRLSDTHVEATSNFNFAIVAWTLAIAAAILLVTLLFYY